MPDQSALTMAAVLVDEMFCHFRVPEELHSDQGRNFETEVSGEVCAHLGVQKTHTAPLHLQSDGLFSRQCSTKVTRNKKVVKCK